MIKTPSSTSLGVVLAALGSAFVMASCTEDPLSLGAADSPGATSQTIDATLAVSSLTGWRDTTVSGFALPSNANFMFVSNEAALSARGMVRFDIPDTIRTFADTLPVADFDSVTLLLRVDTIRSMFSDFPVTFRFVQLGQPFDGDSVNWQQAAPGTPWVTPGGDLGTTIASGTLDIGADSVLMGLSVDEDSLMTAWQEQDGDDGLALLVEGPEARVRVNQILLRYEPTLVGRELPVPQIQGPVPSTFVVNPPIPATGMNLRLGGLPASRLYIDFEPPESINGIPLEGATINHAELILHPLPAPAAPFAIEGPLTTRQITLLGDPFTFGPKTPIGAGEGQTLSLTPELLGDATPLELDITLLLAQALAESDGSIRLGLRGDPDAQVLGFWEFGSIESAVAARPQLRIIFSPSPEFTVP